MIHFPASWLSIEGVAMTTENGTAVKSVEYPESNNFSQPLMQYYTTATNAVLGDSEEVRNVRTSAIKARAMLFLSSIKARPFLRRLILVFLSSVPA